MSPVWSGTPTSVQYAAEGSGNYGVPPELVRLISAGFPASFWNMPRPGSDPGMYNSLEILVYTPSKNYTAADLGSFIAVRWNGVG